MDEWTEYPEKRGQVDIIYTDFRRPLIKCAIADRFKN